MLDWLRSDPRKPPTLELCGRCVPIIISRRSSAKRMTMRLARDGSEVRVTMPTWGPTSEALNFAASRQSWLEQQLVASPPPLAIAPGMVVPFRGTPLILQHNPAARRRPFVDDGSVIMGGAVGALERRLRQWLQGEAVPLLREDLAYYCAKTGRDCPPISLSNAKARWGSCAANGAIRINWRLIMAPDYVRRSVVAHEVAHLTHFDHSAKFHAHLASIFEGDIAVADSWLKHEGRGLYHLFG